MGYGYVLNDPSSVCVTSFLVWGGWGGLGASFPPSGSWSMVMCVGRRVGREASFQCWAPASSRH